MTLDSEDEGMDLEPSSDHEEKEQQVPKRKVKARISEREKILDDGRNSKHRDQNRDDVPVSYTHLTLPTTQQLCRSRWSPYH